MSWQGAAGEPWPKRLAWIVETFAGGDPERFATRIDVHKETVRLWGKTMRPGMDNLVAILNAYPRVNPEWLVTGRGPRERSESDAVAGVVARDIMGEVRSFFGELATRYGEAPTLLPESDEAANARAERTRDSRASAQAATQPDANEDAR